MSTFYCPDRQMSQYLVWAIQIGSYQKRPTVIWTYLSGPDIPILLSVSLVILRHCVSFWDVSVLSVCCWLSMSHTHRFLCCGRPCAIFLQHATARCCVRFQWAHKIAFIAMSKHKNLFLSTTHRMAGDQHQTQSTDLLAADNGLFVNVLPVQFLYCLVDRVMGFLTATQHKHLTQQKRRLNVIEYEKKAINFYVWAMNFEVPLGPGRFGWAKNRSQSQNRRVVRLLPRWAIVTKSYGVAISPRGGSSH